MPTPSALDRFLRVMEAYNGAIWPLQLVAYGLGIAVVIVAFRGTRRSSSLLLAIVALFWLWVGIVFNWLYFSALSRMAAVFAALFVIQGIIFVVAAFGKGGLSFRVRGNAYGIVGGVLVLYAMFGYPAIEYLLGRGFPQSLAFGLVPCPTTVFTLGVLLWSDGRVPKYLLAIPFLYSLGGIGPVSMGIVEDTGLIAAGLVSTAMIVHRDHRRGRTTARYAVAPDTSSP